MTVADDLEAARAALVMINPAPYNAEAPPAALVGDVTPTELHYVRSNFAVPEHDGTLEIGGAVGAPTTLTLDDLRAMPAHDHTVTLECAGNGRLDMRPLPTGEPWGDFAVSTARWTGALLHEVLAKVEPAAQGVEVLAQGADHGPYHLQAILPETDQDNLTFTRSLPIDEATDPASGILIAYEMNGQPLGRDHGAPFRLIVPHWYAVASVKWLKRLDVLTEPLHRRVPDRSLHLPVARPTPRARLPDAGARPDHRPGTRLDPRRRYLHGPREGLVRHRPHHPRGRQPHRRGRLAARTARTSPRRLPLAGLELHLGRRSTSADTPCGPERPTPPATCSPTCPRGTAWATATTPSKSSTSTVDEQPRGLPLTPLGRRTGRAGRAGTAPTPPRSGSGRPSGRRSRWPVPGRSPTGRPYRRTTRWPRRGCRR